MSLKKKPVFIVVVYNRLWPKVNQEKIYTPTVKRPKVKPLHVVFKNKLVLNHLYKCYFWLGKYCARLMDFLFSPTKAFLINGMAYK